MFRIAATKKGQFPVKIEKRAKGKRVTLISNVTGDAVGMVKTLRAALGVGGGARRDNVTKTFIVELQGDQRERVAHMLLDNNWVKGLSKDLLPKPTKVTTVVDRSKTTKYLAKTKDDADLSRLFEQGYDYLDNIELNDDDVFDSHFEFYDDCPKVIPQAPMTEAEIDAALLVLGMLPSVGRALLQAEDGLTLDEYQRRGLAPGARLLTNGPLVKEKENPLRGRQKITHWKNRIRDGHYFHISDERTDGAGELGWTFEKTSDGTSFGTCRLEVPWKTPTTSSNQEALRKEVLTTFQCSLPGYCFRDPYIVLSVREEDIMGTNGDDKEAMKLEKKIREIQKLTQKPEGEIEKLQKDKIERRIEYFEALVYRKDYEKQLRDLFKQEKEALDRAFFEVEKTLTVDEDDIGLAFQSNENVSLEEKGRLARGTRGWQTVRIADKHIAVGRSVNFGIEVIRGLLRLGFENAQGQWAYGGTGKKMQKGSFVDYGHAYGAGDVIHASCGPEGISFAKNGEDLGIAFEAAPTDGVGFVCGKDDFRVRLLFWEDDAPFEGDVFEPTKLATVQKKHDNLCPGEIVNVRSRDGKGFCFVFYVDEEDGWWVPENCLSLEDHDDGISTTRATPYSEGGTSVISPSDDGTAYGTADNDNEPVPNSATNLWDAAPEATAQWGAAATGTPNQWETGPAGTSNRWDTAPRATPMQWDASPQVASAKSNAPSAPSQQRDSQRRDSPPKSGQSKPVAYSVPTVVRNRNGNSGGGNTTPTPATSTTATPPIPLTPTPATPATAAAKAASGRLGVTGLSAWLQELSLMQYEPLAIQWCMNNGAIDLQQVLDNHAEFCDALDMRPIEKRRVRKAVLK